MTKKPFLPLAAAALVFASVPFAFAGSISTTTINGETVVKWNGKEVFKGTVDGPVSSKTATMDGEELAAILAGEKVIWESRPGAADAIKAAAPAIKLPAAKASDKGIKVATAGGESVVTFEGKEVWKGATKKAVTAKEKTVDGRTYAAAFDGKKVLWENVPGAAEKVGRRAKKPETI
jgi:hypothetical protein